MKINWAPPNLRIECDEDEKQVIDYLVETRKIAGIEMELSHWLSGREGTIKEELKLKIIRLLVPDGSIEELKEKLDELENG